MRNAKQESNTIKFETDDQVMKRIETRFSILHDMTKAVIAGDVRAMIVTGPPGVGKSYGVEQELDKSSMLDQIAGRGIKYEVVKGAMTALGLYAKLYEHADKNHVIVFDDCDSVLMDELSLNILKAALDSGKKRVLHWNADSAKLRAEGIPNKFEFKGGVIFITNVKFENIRSKKLQDHLEALQSRCHCKVVVTIWILHWIQCGTSSCVSNRSVLQVNCLLVMISAQKNKTKCLTL